MNHYIDEQIAKETLELHIAQDAASSVSLVQNTRAKENYSPRARENQRGKIRTIDASRGEAFPGSRKTLTSSLV